MNAAIRRKLNEHIEFAAGKQPGKLDPQELRAVVREMLDYREQTAILNDALLEAISAWIKKRIDRSRPEQMPLPDFPHVSPLIRVGKHAVGIENATAKELEVYFQKLKVRVADQEENLAERLQQSLDGVRNQMMESLAQAKAELEEITKLRKLVRQADRTYPGITVSQVLQREAEKKKTKV